MESSAAARLRSGDPDKDGPLPAPVGRSLRHPVQLLFEGVHQGGEIQLQGAHLVGVENGPVVAVQRLGQEMRHLDGAGQALGGDREGRHRVQAQQGQVHQVVLVQRGPVQVGVDEPEALEAALDPPLPGQRRNHQAFGVPHDDVGDEALAVQHDPHLTVQVPGDLRQLPGQLRGQEFPGRHPAAVQPFQPLILVGLDAGEITEGSMDG